MTTDDIPETVTIKIHNPILVRAMQISDETGCNVGDAMIVAEREARESESAEEE